jgi:hypothetical protein
MTLDFSNGRKPTPLLLRPTYEAALAPVVTAFTAGKPASLTLLDTLAKAAADYAATTEGAERVASDAAAADTAADFERAATLRAAHTQGLTHKAALDQTTAILKPKTPEPQPTLGQRPLREWSAEQPVWPKKEDTLKVIASTSVRPADEALALKAFRSLFAKAWRECFYPEDGLLYPVGPYNDDEGWRWRRFATEQASRKIAGAESVKPETVSKGMCVYTGFGIRVVAAVTAIGAQDLADASGTVKKVATYRVTYKDGKADDGVPADTVFIRLPALEKKADKPAPDKRIDFS